MSRSVRHPGLHDAKGRDLAHAIVDVMDVPVYAVDAGEGPPVVLIHVSDPATTVPGPLKTTIAPSSRCASRAAASRSASRSAAGR